MRIYDEHRWLNNHLRRIREYLVDNRELPLADELRRAWSVTCKIEPGIGVHGRVKDSRAATNNCFVVSESGAPGKAKARREVGLVCEHQVVAQSVIPNKRQECRRSWVTIELHRRKILERIARARPHDYRRSSAEVHVDHRILQIVPVRRDLVSQTEIQGHVTANLEVILNVVGLCPAK